MATPAAARTTAATWRTGEALQADFRRSGCCSSGWLTEAALSPCTLNDVERVFSEVGLAGAACKLYAILRCGYREVSLCSHGFDHLKIETLTR